MVVSLSKTGMKGNYMFKQIINLRSRLSDLNELDVVHDSHLWRARFEWSYPASEEKIKTLTLQIPSNLPADFIIFLSKIANGAVLYYDKVYGQWGYKIYGTEDIVEKQEYWHKCIPIDQWSQFIVFAELYGEATIMVFDLDRPSRDKNSFAVLEASAYDPVDEWRIASKSYHEWLDRLVTAQGDKYWV
jgi:hypothetical protein